MRAVVLALIVLATPAAQDRPLPDQDAFAAQVKRHLATDEERQSGYTFIEKRIEQKLDASGRSKDQSVKVFEVYPGLPGEERYRRLIEENGRPVPAGDLAKRDRSRQKEVEEYARKVAIASERTKATREQDKARREYSAAVDDIFRIYDIRMQRREPIDGHDTIVATLTPIPGMKPLTDDGKIMRHFKARAWISDKGRHFTMWDDQFS